MGRGGALIPYNSIIAAQPTVQFIARETAAGASGILTPQGPDPALHAEPIPRTILSALILNAYKHTHTHVYIRIIAYLYNIHINDRRLCFAFIKWAC